MTPAGVMLCDDLLFSSKVTTTARALGLTVVPAKTPDAALANAKAIHAVTVFIELHTPGLVLSQFLESLRSLDPLPRIIAFGSHVDKASLNAAKAAGCDLVMPRSKFVASLETELAGWLSPRESTPAE
jgi:DNA-binding NarL/FixJ family response regulator